MQTNVSADNQLIDHPIDLIETLAASREWPFERGTEDDVNVCVSGTFCDYHLAISWRPDLGGLHVASVLDTRASIQARRNSRIAGLDKRAIMAGSFRHLVGRWRHFVSQHHVCQRQRAFRGPMRGIA